ncbi:MAG: phosphatase PAP2 family protein [Myxococcales bacterium]|nr:phosphatase PAP2 family protein [Myxococcales bacterium]MDD9971497.1 phosphatase PAP2 family protein [Myxococcales bacterium]
MPRSRRTVGGVPALLRVLGEQPELRPLLAVLCAVGALLAFTVVATVVMDGRVVGIDEWVLLAARKGLVRSPSTPVAEIALNITALGGFPVLTLVVLCVVGFLLVHRLPGRALYVVAVAAGGAGLQALLKGWFLRARPQVVQPLVSVHSWSFPSGHAMMSAAVYLAVGSLVAASIVGRRGKLYVLTVAIGLSGLVGASRVLLGVHYPSDVLAGWMAGLAWALVCWAALEMRLRTGPLRSAGQ